ncbi:MAG: hypothetical protein LBU43_03650 [Candidatus Accumulibacter sp.]|jgi:hypothetical protein|nr:hypothetical protein [Accumulibacter sp.]
MKKAISCLLYALEVGFFSVVFFYAWFNSFPVTVLFGCGDKFIPADQRVEWMILFFSIGSLLIFLFVEKFYRRNLINSSSAFMVSALFILVFMIFNTPVDNSFPKLTFIESPETKHETNEIKHRIRGGVIYFSRV